MSPLRPTVELTRDLVRIPSENPPTTEDGVSEFVHRWLASVPGLTVERHEIQPGRSNVVARLSSGTSAPAFAMLAHMDTVPVGEGWTRNPFGGEIVDGLLYGRGACDMKAGLAVVMSVLATSARSAQKPRRDIVVCATVDEEGSQMLGGNDLITRGVVNRESLVVATEPSDLEIIVAHKGLVWMEIQTTGKLAHAGNPQLGVDAVRAAAEFVTRFHRAVSLLPQRHEMLGRPTVTFSHASGGIKTNVVPNHARLELDIRLPPPMSIAEVHGLVERCAREVEAEIPGCSVAYKQMNNERPPVETDCSTELVLAMSDAVRAVTGGANVLAGFPAYTDASVVQARTGNRTALVFGPGRLAQAHSVDEYVPVEHIEKAEAIMARAVNSLCFG
jgi:succinyl-diaminopimelate desuccinylase